MSTEWKYRIYVITKNKTLGQSLAEMGAAFPDDPNAEENTFVNRLQTSPQGWAVVIPAREDFKQAVDALIEDAAIDDPRLSLLVSRGLNASTWGQAKQNLIINVYQVWLEDGTYVSSPTLAEFCTNNGHTLIETPEAP